ncbi:MAG: pentapeptide repeat-containing protein, partial [Candidatus Omnitrophota bacterium]
FPARLDIALRKQFSRLGFEWISARSRETEKLIERFTDDLEYAESKLGVRTARLAEPLPSDKERLTSVQRQRSRLRRFIDAFMRKVGRPRARCKKGVKVVGSEPKGSSEIRLHDRNFGTLTRVHTAEYKGETYFVKFVMDRDISTPKNYIADRRLETLRIIPQADILSYLKRERVEVISLPEHFLEMRFGSGERIKAILFKPMPPGETLQAKIENRLMPQEEAVDVILKVSETVKKLRDKGVYHWDIKPDNIWITDAGKVILFDFDLAFRNKKEFMKRNLFRMGNPDFMSRARGRWSRGFPLSADPEGPLFEADEVYALAKSLLHSVRGGFRPVYGDPWLRPGARLRELNGKNGISPELQRLLQKALSDGKSDYASVDEFIRDLKHCRKVLIDKYPTDPFWLEEEIEKNGLRNFVQISDEKVPKVFKKARYITGLYEYAKGDGRVQLIKKKVGNIDSVKGLFREGRNNLCPTFFLEGDKEHVYELNLIPFGYVTLHEVAGKDMERLTPEMRKVIREMVWDNFGPKKSWYGHGHIHADNIMVKPDGKGGFSDIRVIDWDCLRRQEPVECLKDYHAGARKDLAGVKIIGNIMEGYDLQGVNLSGSVLKMRMNWSSLRRADLRVSDLSYADLSGADLRDALLRGGNLEFTYFVGADLTGADLVNTNMRHSCLIGADLTGADLRGSCLIFKYTDIDRAILADTKFDRRRAAEFEEKGYAVEYEGNYILVTSPQKVLPDGSPLNIFDFLRAKFKGKYVGAEKVRKLTKGRMKDGHLSPETVKRDLGTLLYLGLVEKKGTGDKAIFRAADLSPPGWKIVSSILRPLGARPTHRRKRFAKRKLSSLATKVFKESKWIRKGGTLIPFMVSNDHHEVVPWIQRLQKEKLAKKRTAVINLDFHGDATLLGPGAPGIGNWIRWLIEEKISTGRMVWVTNFENQKMDPIDVPYAPPGTRDYECYGRNGIFASVEEMTNKVKTPAIITVDFDFIAPIEESVITEEGIRQRVAEVLDAVFSSDITPVAINLTYSEGGVSGDRYLIPGAKERIARAFHEGIKARGFTFESEVPPDLKKAPARRGAPFEVFDLLRTQFKGKYAAVEDIRKLTRGRAKDGHLSKRTVEEDLKTLVFLDLVRRSDGGEKYRAAVLSPPEWKVVEPVLKSLGTRPDKKQKEAAKEKLQKARAAASKDPPPEQDPVDRDIEEYTRRYRTGNPFMLLSVALRKVNWPVVRFFIWVLREKLQRGEIRFESMLEEHIFLKAEQMYEDYLRRSSVRELMAKNKDGSRPAGFWSRDGKYEGKEPPPGSLYKVFEYLVDNNITWMNTLTIEEIASGVGRAVSTIEPDIRGLKRLCLIEDRIDADAGIKYFVPETVKRRAHLFKTILAGFVRGKLRPNKDLLEKVYRNEVRPVLVTPWPDSCGLIAKGPSGDLFTRVKTEPVNVEDHILDMQKGIESAELSDEERAVAGEILKMLKSLSGEKSIGSFKGIFRDPEDYLIGFACSASKHSFRGRKVADHIGLVEEFYHAGHELNRHLIEALFREGAGFHYIAKKEESLFTKEPLMFDYDKLCRKIFGENRELAKLLMDLVSRKYPKAGEDLRFFEEASRRLEETDPPDDPYFEDIINEAKKKGLSESDAEAV